MHHAGSASEFATISRIYNINVGFRSIKGLTTAVTATESKTSSSTERYLVSKSKIILFPSIWHLSGSFIKIIPEKEESGPIK